MNPIATLVASSKELRRTRSLVQAAMLLALQAMLSAYASVYINPTIKVDTGFIAAAATGTLFGPFVAMINGGLTDFIQYALRPSGPFFPGYTLSAMLNGLIYGFAFYRREIRPIHVVLARLIIVIFVNLGLGTLWLHMLYGDAYMALFPPRALASLIKLPFETAILLFLVDRFKKMS